MDALRKTALVAGGFYLITFVSSIPAVFLLDPVLNDSSYIVSSGADTRVLLGCFLDLINAVACVGTAVVLFPVLKRQQESVALGFVTARVLEAAVIIVGTPVMGLVGAPLLIASATATLFRSNERVTALAAIATVPVFLWELSLGVWLVVKGFQPCPITAGMQSAGTPAHRDV
jgi:hypothetical protein